jgi:hypothetical protein
MFCPQCKTEYRPGFTKCADCGVDLVSSLPGNRAAADSDLITNAEGLELLWSGLNKSLSSAIDGALEEAHIFHKVTDRALKFLATSPDNVIFIWIDPKDRSAASNVLENVLETPEISGRTDIEMESDAQQVNPFGFGRRVYNRVPDEEREEITDETNGQEELPEARDSDEPVPDDIADDPDPDDATAEVWAGEDADMADFIANSLRGVGVGCVIDDASGKHRVMVLPAAEKRAGEVVHEIVDDSPPQ